MDDFNAKLDRIQREFEALQRQVKAQNTLHLQSLAEQREVITAAFSDMQRSFAKLERTFANLQDGFANLQSGFANLQSGFANLQDGFANLQDGLTNVQDGLKETQENTSRGFGQVHTALWRHELLLKDLTVQTESRFGIVGDVLDLTRSQNALTEQRWSDLDERVRRLEERDPPAA